MEFNCNQITIMTISIIGITILVKPSVFIFVSKYFKYKYINRPKLIRKYLKMLRSTVEKYNSIVDLIASKRREADDTLFNIYNQLLSAGMPEYLARKTADEINHQMIAEFDKIVNEKLIPTRNEFVKKHNEVSFTIRSTVERYDKLFGIKNGYMPFKVI